LLQVTLMRIILGNLGISMRPTVGDTLFLTVDNPSHKIDIAVS
jgi:hypothetical protein